MTEWPTVNSEYELSDQERDDYAFAIYCRAAHARARAKAEADLQRRIDRGDWPPKIHTENGVSYMKRTTPLKRRSKR